jgi:MYXO-CTERM domain-containing protein
MKWRAIGVCGVCGLAAGSSWAFSPDRAGPCGTLNFLDETLAAQPAPLPPRPPSTDKGEREAHGTCANTASSDNFVLKWGDDASVSGIAVTQLLDAFEFSWAQQIDSMGHPPPWGTDEYKFNVYVGDSGSCAPSVYGMGGYYTTDAEGWPMIVMSLGTLDYAPYGQSVAAHEFYHAVQHATGSYGGSSDASWYWEATACWVEKEVFVSDEHYASFLFGYAFMPYKQLNAYQYPGTGAIEEYHQYGAFIFPRYLSEHHSDWTLIRDSWVDASWNSDPVDMLEVLLEGGDLEETFGDYAAHNATWDYEDQLLYTQHLDYTSDETDYGLYDRRVVESVGYQGTGDEWAEPPTDTFPERYGYNIIRLKSPADRKLTVRFEGDAAGSEGSTGRYQVRLVREYGTTVDYLEVPIDGLSGELKVGKVGAEVALYLAVSAFSDHWREGETFGYRYQLDMGEVTDSGGGSGEGGSMAQNLGVEEDEKGCACAQGAGPGGMALAVLGLALAGARRRPRYR